MDVPHFACPHPSMDTCVAPTFPLLWLALLYIYKKNVFQALARATWNPFPFLFFCWLDKADTVVHHVDKSNSPEMEGPGPPTTSWSRGSSTQSFTWEKVRQSGGKSSAPRKKPWTPPRSALPIDGGGTSLLQLRWSPRPACENHSAPNVCVSGRESLMYQCESPRLLLLAVMWS